MLRGPQLEFQSVNLNLSLVPVPLSSNQGIFQVLNLRLVPVPLSSKKGVFQVLNLRLASNWQVVNQGQPYSIPAELTVSLQVMV